MNDHGPDGSTPTEDIGYFAALMETIREIGSPSSPLDRWRPVPEDQIHRGLHLAVAVHSPAPNVIGLAICDDRGTSAGFALSIWDATTIIGLLQGAVEAAEARPRTAPR